MRFHSRPYGVTDREQVPCRGDGGTSPTEPRQLNREDAPKTRPAASKRPVLGSKKTGYRVNLGKWPSTCRAHPAATGMRACSGGGLGEEGGAPGAGQGPLCSPRRLSATQTPHRLAARQLERAGVQPALSPQAGRYHPPDPSTV